MFRDLPLWAVAVEVERTDVRSTIYVDTGPKDECRNVTTPSVVRCETVLPLIAPGGGMKTLYIPAEGSSVETGGVE